MRNTTSFHDEYYAQLEGAFIQRYGGINEEGFPVFEIHLAGDSRKLGSRKFTIEISGDEEGNHGGFIFGLPVPEMGKEHDIE